MNKEYAFNHDFLKELKDINQKQFETYNISQQFSSKIAGLNKNNLKAEPCAHRKDFRGEKGLTIDCYDGKDKDDAVSLIRTAKGYRLAVHIADVSAYIPLGSELDQEAISRATSIYLPNLTVPMLPPVLSNDLCSLNPGVPRNTLSVIMHLNKNGEVIKSEITKGLIKSRVNGVYSEVNQILAGNADNAIQDKYNDVYDELFVMAELYEILRAERIRRGARIEDDNKPKITVYKHSIELKPVKEGIAENMIEEFMILANRVVAEYLYENNLPAIFRIQETKNNKAAYRSFKTHHAELCLDSYSHFTSPIRRIADLKIHQIITMHLNGVSNEKIHELFDESLEEVCDRATKRSRTAKSIQDYCEHYCYRQYFNTHSRTRFKGMLVGFDKRQRPILQVSNFNIKVIGYAVIGGSIGEQYMFNVRVSHDKDMVTTKVQRLAA